MSEQPRAMSPGDLPPSRPDPDDMLAASGPLRAIPSAPRYALVGEEVVLDGAMSTGAVRQQWFFGNGQSGEATAETQARAVYDQPGRYQVVLRVFDAQGQQHSAGVTVSVTYPVVDFGTFSSTLARIPGSDDAVVVSTDSNQLIVVSAADGPWRVVRRIDTCAGPRTVTIWQGRFVTGCQQADRVGFYPIDGTSAPSEVALAYGAAPYGVATDGELLFVGEQGPGKLTRIGLSADGAPEVQGTVDAIPDARGVAALPDGRVAVTRWRAAANQSEVAFVDPLTGASERVGLAIDTQAASDAGISGIPSYLGQFAVSPTGREAFIPSLMANYNEGAFLTGRALTFETTLRAALSRVDLLVGAEDFPRRFQFDERGFAEALAFSSHGDFAYVVMPGNRSLVTLDLLTGVESGVFANAGFAPDGAVVVGQDDSALLVNAPLSRELVVYDLTTNAPSPLTRVALLENEPLDPVVLRGKQLFNDAADTRLASSGYIACANCHLDGDSDHQVWDFTNRGEGLRNTISMLGRAGTGDGPVHWSANFDEIQDFEHDMRNAFGGTGLIDDAVFNDGALNTPLGASKAGVSADLDALAAYATSLTTNPRSPFRNPDGSLTAAALRGKARFESAELDCGTCHSGPRMTDSRWVAPAQPLLHDVGTFRAGSGQRLGQGPLPGLDTPTLIGLWSSAPYLHDGSATTLREVIAERNTANQHGQTSQLAAAEVDDLVAYLLSLDGSADE